MPIRVLRFAGVAAASLAFLPAAAHAATKGAALTVVAGDGSTLADLTQYTETTRIPTDPHAKCFGKGTGGSGHSFKLDGATALGLVRDAIPNAPALRPLSVSDHYLDSFGPGVCGIGGDVAPPSGYWYLKVDHVGSSVGGGQRIHDGDSVLWYLAPGFPAGDELDLKLPARAKPRVPVRATVYAYADDGTRTPAQGASVDFAASPTDANGHTDVVFPSAGGAGVAATLTGDIPSPVLDVCVNSSLAECPSAFGKTIYGSDRADRISTGRGDDYVAAGPGGDTVDIRKGGSDTVNCGSGRDRVIATKGDGDDAIRPSCERVVRR